MNAFTTTLAQLMSTVGEEVVRMAHAGADMQAVECLRTMLPPVLSESWCGLMFHEIFVEFSNS